MGLITSIDLSIAVNWWSILLMHSLWVAPVVAFFVAMILKLTRLENSARRSAVALLGLIGIVVGSATMATLGMADVKVDVTENASLTATSTTLAITGGPPVPSESRGIIVMMWFLGAITMFARLAVAHISAQDLILSANIGIPDWLDQMLEELSQQIGSVRGVTIRISDHVSGPMVYGFFWPVVLLPSTLLTDVPPQSIRAILAHELAHVRRWDMWLGLIQRLIESAFFFHPAVWWLSHQVQNEREMACDAIAARLVGKRTDVASALVDSVESAASEGWLATLAANGGALQQRVMRLVDPASTENLRVPWTSFMGLTFIGMFGFTSLTAGTSAIAVQISQTLTLMETVDAMQEAVEKAKVWRNQDAFAEVTGRLLYPDGTPASDLNTYCMIEGSSVRIRTNELGVLTGKIAGPGKLYLSPYPKHIARKEYGPFIVESPKVDIGDVILEPGFGATIKVVDQKGQPVPEARVTQLNQQFTLGGRTSPWEWTPSSNAWDPKSTLLSDADGVLTLEHLTGDPFTITLSKPGFERQTRKNIVFKAGQEVRWDLKPSENVTGQIVDANGNPIAGVHLHLVGSKSQRSIPDWPDPRASYIDVLAIDLRMLFDENGNRFADPFEKHRLVRHGMLYSVTDSEGHFEIPSLRDDTTYSFMAVHPSHQPTIIEDVHPGKALETIQLAPGIIFKGKVRGELPEEASAHGVRILCYENSRPDQRGSSRFWCEVDDEGRFAIENLFSGNLRLFAPGRSATIVDVPLTESVHDFQFDVGVETRSIHVELQSEWNVPVRGHLNLKWELPQQNGRPVVGQKRFDADKAIRWNVPLDAKLFFEGSRLIGSYKKQVEMIGVVESGLGEQNFTVSLDPAGMLAGAVVDHRGQPVKAYSLQVNRLGPDGESKEKKISVQHPAGRFAVWPLPLNLTERYQTVVIETGTWRIGMSNEYHIDRNNMLHREVFALSAPVKYQGRVLSADATVAAGANLQLSWQRNGARTNVGKAIQTDEAGRFQFEVSSEGIEGEYYLTIFPRQGAGRQIALPTHSQNAENNLGDIRLGQTFQLTQSIAKPQEVDLKKLFLDAITMIKNPTTSPYQRQKAVSKLLSRQQKLHKGVPMETDVLKSLEPKPRGEVEKALSTINFAQIDASQRSSLGFLILSSKVQHPDMPMLASEVILDEAVPIEVRYRFMREMRDVKSADYTRKLIKAATQIVERSNERVQAKEKAILEELIRVTAIQKTHPENGPAVISKMQIYDRKFFLVLSGALQYAAPNSDKLTNLYRRGLNSELPGIRADTLRFLLLNERSDQFTHARLLIPELVELFPDSRPAFHLLQSGSFEKTRTYLKTMLKSEDSKRVEFAKTWIPRFEGKVKF